MKRVDFAREFPVPFAQNTSENIEGEHLLRKHS